MTDAINNINKSARGRPRTDSKPVMVRLQPDDLAALDNWIAANEPDASRPEAMRRILRMVVT
jgi:cytochrome c553